MRLPWQIMSEQNNLNPNRSNNELNYQDLSLEELKKIAEAREITPEGNKTFKDTWIQALEEYDRLARISKAGDRNEDLAAINNTELAESESLIVEQTASREAEDYVLENIVTALEQRRVDVNRLEINLDGRNIFKMRDGNIANSTINEGQMELIKQALNDPASFKGSMKITNGSQVLLHVNNGRVLRDGLNLTKTSTKVEINSAPADLYDKYSQNVASIGLKATKEIAVKALSDGVSVERVKKMIESEDSAYQNLSASAGRNAASSTIDKIVTSAAAEVKIRNSSAKSQQQKKAPALTSKR